MYTSSWGSAKPGPTLCQSCMLFDETEEHLLFFGPRYARPSARWAAPLCCLLWLTNWTNTLKIGKSDSTSVIVITVCKFLFVAWSIRYKLSIWLSKISTCSGIVYALNVISSVFIDVLNIWQSIIETVDFYLFLFIFPTDFFYDIYVVIGTCWSNFIFHLSNLNIISHHIFLKQIWSFMLIMALKHSFSPVPCKLNVSTQYVHTNYLVLPGHEKVFSFCRIPSSMFWILV